MWKVKVLVGTFNQEIEGPSSSLLCDCEIFVNLCLTLVWSCRTLCSEAQQHAPGAGAGVGHPPHLRPGPGQLRGGAGSRAGRGAVMVQGDADIFIAGGDTYTVFKRPFSIVSQWILNCVSTRGHFQQGEDPSRALWQVCWHLYTPGGDRVRVHPELAAAAAQPPGPRPQRPARPPRPHLARGRAGAGQPGHLGRGRHQDAG